MSFGNLYIPSLGGQMYPNARKILAAAHVNSLTLATPAMEFGTTNKSPDYLSKFPLGKVPAFESASGDFCLWESDAIAHYVSLSGPRADQLLGSTPEEKAKVQQWIHFCTCHLAEAVIGLARWRMGFGTYDEAKEASFQTELERWGGHLEEQLADGRASLVKGAAAAGGPSLADFTIAGVLRIGLVTIMDKEFRAKFPKTFEWYSKVTEVDEKVKEMFAGDWIETKKAKPDDA